MKRIFIIFAGTALFVFGAVVSAHAHGGMGWGNGWDYDGIGRHHNGYYGSDYAHEDPVRSEQSKAYEQKRAAFLKETKELRANLYAKERELQNELSNDAPDAAKASALQRDVSALQAQLDQKRIEHMLEMKKMAPSAGRGYMRGGPMMGYGARGGGPCWR